MSFPPASRFTQPLWCPGCNERFYARKARVESAHGAGVELLCPNCARRKQPAAKIGRPTTTGMGRRRLPCPRCGAPRWVAAVVAATKLCRTCAVAARRAAPGKPKLRKPTRAAFCGYPQNRLHREVVRGLYKNEGSKAEHPYTYVRWTVERVCACGGSAGIQQFVQEKPPALSDLPVRCPRREVCGKLFPAVVGL